MSGVYVAPSVWRALDVRTAAALMASIGSNPNHEKVVFEPLWNDALLGRSRSLMATAFLEAEYTADCDVMVIIDDDVVWEPSDFWKIVEGARATRSVYGGVYVTRSTTPHISSRLWPNTPLDFHQGAERRPVKIEYLATGFWAVHRDVFEAMRDGEFRDADGTHRLHRVTKGADRPFIPFFSPFTIEDEPGNYHYLSEDWAFGERANQLGFDAWMDQSIILQHMGLYPFTVADLNGARAGLPSTGTDRVIINAPSTPPTGEPLIDNLLQDVAEWSEDELGTIQRMAATAPARLAELWQSKGEQFEAEWYRREDVGLLYVLDLARWHTSGNGCPAALAKGRTGQLILDYGAGIGTWALIAAREGAAVICYEPNPISREFGEWRARKYGIAIRYLDDDDGEPVSFADAIFCWHVFEHLEDPEAVLDRMTVWLAPHGELITGSGFEDRNTPMHNHPCADWETVLARHGFAEASPFVYRKARVAVPA